MNRTSIGWTEFSWNPVVGCKRGCEYCYARKMAKRGLGEYGEHPKEERFKPRFLPERLLQPTERNRGDKVSTKHGSRRM